MVAIWFYVLLAFFAVFYIVVGLLVAATLYETQDQSPLLSILIGFWWGPIGLLGLGVRLYDRYIKGEKYPSA